MIELIHLKKGERVVDVQSMEQTSNSRIQTLDLLKGVVMAIMVLDHVRDYFHADAFFFDPADPGRSNLPVFFTRWITDFCAPAFSLLAGVSIYLVGTRKTSWDLSVYLVKRGAWLILLEVTIITFGWHFDPGFRNIILQTIWSLGVSMLFLAGLIHFPKKIILIFSCLLIGLHNLLDDVHLGGNIFWAILHERDRFEIIEGHTVVTAYPLLPWVAIPSLGYCVGDLYGKLKDAVVRRKILNTIGFAALMLLVLLLYLNRYGDPLRWQRFDEFSKTLMSLLSATKYPPSLRFLLLTLGAAFLFLANTEMLKGRIVTFFCTLGRVPFFFYILHIYVIHFLALLAAELTGFGWRQMILPKFVIRVESLKGYGFSLVTVYILWITVILTLYPLCKKFDRFKQTHKDKSWLSYL